MHSKQLFRRGNRLEFQPACVIRGCKDVGFLSVGSSVVTPLGKARGSANASWEGMFLHTVGLFVSRNSPSSSGCTCSPIRVPQGTRSRGVPWERLWGILAATTGLASDQGAEVSPCLTKKLWARILEQSARVGERTERWGQPAMSSLKFHPTLLTPLFVPAFVVRNTGAWPTRANDS